MEHLVHVVDGHSSIWMHMLLLVPGVRRQGVATTTVMQITMYSKIQKKQNDNDWKGEEGVSNKEFKEEEEHSTQALFPCGNKDFHLLCVLRAPSIVRRIRFSELHLWTVFVYHQGTSYSAAHFSLQHHAYQSESLSVSELDLEQITIST